MKTVIALSLVALVAVAVALAVPAKARTYTGYRFEINNMQELPMSTAYSGPSAHIYGIHDKDSGVELVCVVGPHGYESGDDISCVPTGRSW